MRQKIRRANAKARAAVAWARDILVAIGKAVGPREMAVFWGAVLLYWGLSKVYEPAAPIVIGSLLIAIALWPLVRKAN